MSTNHLEHLWLADILGIARSLEGLTFRAAPQVGEILNGTDLHMAGSVHTSFCLRRVISPRGCRWRVSAALSVWGRRRSQLYELPFTWPGHISLATSLVPLTLVCLVRFQTSQPPLIQKLFRLCGTNWNLTVYLLHLGEINLVSRAKYELEQHVKLQPAKWLLN